MHLTSKDAEPIRAESFPTLLQLSGAVFFLPNICSTLIMSVLPNTMGFIVINDNYCY